MAPRVQKAKPDTAAAQKKRWRRQPHLRPDAILDSALVLFRRRGVAATRIEDIAKGAGLSKGAVYLYFDSKETMVKALVERAVLPLAKQFEMIASDIKPSQIHANIELFTAMLSEKVLDQNVVAVPLLIISEAGRFPELAEFYRQQILDRVIAAIAKLLQAGMDGGLFRSDLRPTYAVRSLIGGIFMQVVWHHIFAPSTSNPAEVRRQIAHHTNLFIKGISVS